MAFPSKMHSNGWANSLVNVLILEKETCCQKERLPKNAQGNREGCLITNKNHNSRSSNIKVYSEGTSLVY